MELTPIDDVIEYMIWVVEITSREFFNGDKGAAYRAMLDSGIWVFYIAHYDTTHTMSAEAILDEIGERFAGNRLEGCMSANHGCHSEKYDADIYTKRASKAEHSERGTLLM